MSLRRLRLVRRSRFTVPRRRVLRLALILPGTHGEEARTVAERLRSAVAVEDFTDGRTPDLRITISIGVTQYRQEEIISSFVQRADQAMYRSKQAGRNRVSCIFDNPVD